MEVKKTNNLRRTNHISSNIHCESALEKGFRQLLIQKQRYATLRINFQADVVQKTQFGLH